MKHLKMLRSIDASYWYSGADRYMQYCTPTLRDLPNMGQKERGKPSTSSSQPGEGPTTKPRSATLTFVQPLPPSPSASQPSLVPSHTSPINSNSPIVPSSNDPIADGRAAIAAGWGTSLRSVIWEKWRWGVVLVLAVIVSRLSSSS